MIVPYFSQYVLCLAKRLVKEASSAIKSAWIYYFQQSTCQKLGYFSHGNCGNCPLCQNLHSNEYFSLALALPPLGNSTQRANEHCARGSELYNELGQIPPSIVKRGYTFCVIFKDRLNFTITDCIVVSQKPGESSFQAQHRRGLANFRQS